MLLFCGFLALALLALPSSWLPVMVSLLGAIASLVACARALSTPGAWRSLWTLEYGGAALEILTGFVTAPGSTQTALTMSTGDSLAVRAAEPSKIVRLLNAWVDGQVNSGVLRIRSPRLHDNNQGIRLQSVVSEVQALLPMGMWQRLYQTDQLAVDLSGSSTAGDIDTAALLLQYDDLPGIAARMIGLEELMKRGQNVVGVENTISTGTAGGWSGSEAINAEFDPFKANVDYALIGFLTNIEAAAIAWRGADTGNVRVGGPGNEVSKHITAEWFMRLTRMYGLPLIPVMNANNRAGFQVDAAQDEVGSDPVVNSLFVELAPR